jgi:UDP-N-acetylglucosamine 2-epimerase
MDLYRRGDFEIARGAQLDALGLPAHFRYVLMGAYQERLGRHEPELCRQMAAMLAGQGDCALVIRCHPIEPQWRERFGRLHRPPHVVVLPPELGNFERLANQIRHAEIVLSSAGTILLDAIALDTPAIAIALEDESEPYFDRVARRYDMEHWAALVKTGGLPLARSPAELASLIVETLADRQRDAAGRARLVAAHLDPLDGRAAERIVAAIVAAAGAPQARAEAAAS